MLDDDDDDSCLGTHCNNWATVQQLRVITHHLRRGDKNSVAWSVLWWQVPGTGEEPALEKSLEQQ